jgi:hyperosmotically inducible protein
MRTVPLLLAVVSAALAIAGCNPRTENEAVVLSSRASPAGAPAAQPNPAPPPAKPAPSQASSISTDAFSDTVITARTKAAILSDPGMTGADVSVNTDRGVVSLTGIIKSQEQAAIASAHAQRQDGVLRVDNHLSATPQ